MKLVVILALFAITVGTIGILVDAAFNTGPNRLGMDSSYLGRCK